MRRGLFIGACFLGSILALFIGGVIYRAICIYPQSSYDRAINENAFQQDCKNLQTRTPLRTALQSLERSVEPMDEHLDGARVLVRQNRTICIIEFEPTTNLVTKTETQTLPRSPWQFESF